MVSFDRLRKVLRKVMNRSLKPGNRRSLNENDMETIDRASGSQIASIAYQDGMNLFVLCRELDAQYFAYTRRQRNSIKRLLQELRSIDVDFLDGVEIETVEVSTIVVPENVTRTRKNLNPAQIVEPQDPMIQLQDAGQQITDQPIVEQQNTEQQDAAPQNIELQNAQETPNLVQQMSFTNSTSNIRLSIQRDLQPIPRIFNISALQDTPERFQAKASSLIINNTGQVIDTSFIAPVYGSNIQINEISAIDDNSMIPMRYIDNIPVDSETSSRLLAPAQSNMEAFNHEEPQEIVSAIKALEGPILNNIADEILQHPENADSQPVDPQVPRRVHISRTELHYQQLLAEGQAAIAAAENQDPPVEVFVPVAQRARQPRRPRAETPLRLRLTRMNRLFSDVRMPKSVVERIQPSNNVLNTYRKHELMLPDGFDPVALLAAVHLEEDRVHAQEQRELQEKQAQQESVQSRRQAIANAVTQARSVSMPDYVLNTPRSERFSRPLRSTPDPLPVMRDAVVFPENMQNLSLDEIPPSFDQESVILQDFAQEPVDRTLPENSGILHSQLSKNLSLQKPQAFVDDLPETVGRNPTEIENPDIGDSFVIPHPDTTQQPQPRKQIPTAVSNAYQQEGKNVTYTGNPEVAVRDTKNLLVFATLLKLREMSKDISGWKEITRDEINALYKANGLERYDLKSLQALHTRRMITLRNAQRGPNFVIKFKRAKIPFNLNSTEQF